jgi:integrase
MYMARIKLTDRFVSSCGIPASGRIEHSDSICPGLYLRVSSGGVKTFSVIVRHGGLIRRTLGRYPVLKLADARRAALNLMRQLADVPFGEVANANPVLTLAELATRYTDLHLRPNLRSWRMTDQSLKQDALANLHGRDVNSIEKREIVAALDSLVVAGKPHSGVNLLKALRAMYNWAIDRGDVTVPNPCDRVRQPVPTTQRDRMLTDAEIVAVLGACDAVPAPFGAMVRVLLHTGARRNEVAHMRWSELVGNVWTLPAARSKSGRANSLPLASSNRRLVLE